MTGDAACPGARHNGHRQRCGAAPVFEQLRLTITQEPALRITGPLQNVSGVTHVKAETIEPLREADLPAQASNNFH